MLKMKCPKCNGLMYTESFSDFMLAFDIWKCINCGALIDPPILKNKQCLKGKKKTIYSRPVRDGVVASA